VQEYQEIRHTASQSRPSYRVCSGHCVCMWGGEWDLFYCKLILKSYNKDNKSILFSNKLVRLEMKSHKQKIGIKQKQKRRRK
jgi:hypothetical protein